MNSQTNISPSQVYVSENYPHHLNFPELILNNIDGSFILVAPDLTILLISQKAVFRLKKHLGVNAATGSSILDIAPANKRSYLKNIFNQALSGETCVTEFAVVPNGEKNFIEVTFKPVINNAETVAVLVTSKNVTDKKILFANSPLPCWLFDANTFAIIDVNEAAIKHYGYSRGEFLKLTINDIRETTAPMARVIKDAEENTSVELWRHIKKNGEIITVEVTSNIINYEGRKARLCVLNDTTEKKVIEHELIRSNERFKFASKATSDVIYDWDIVTDDLTWGENLPILFGYLPHQVSAKEWDSLVHTIDRRRVIESLDDCIKQSDKNYWKEEYRFKKANGSYRYIFDRGFIIRDKNGNAIRMIGAMQDVTEQKVKEQQIIESKERLANALKATNDLIWDWNLETGSFYRDKEGMKKVYGVEDENSIQNIHAWMQRVHPSDVSRVEKVMNDILHATKEDIFDVEYRFQRDDGTYSYIYDRGIIIRNKEGKPV
ncbi:MAG: PAS domain-containing protein, partial [Chitinophagaceae bacterium]|nr:PAS domain-containing protein [Chitinophagaceae bacterium]